MKPKIVDLSQDSWLSILDNKPGHEVPNVTPSSMNDGGTGKPIIMPSNIASNNDTMIMSDTVTKVLSEKGENERIGDDTIIPSSVLNRRVARSKEFTRIHKRALFYDTDEESSESDSDQKTPKMSNSNKGMC